MTWSTWGEGIAGFPPMLAWATIAAILGLFYAADIALDMIQHTINEEDSEPEPIEEEQE